MRIVEACFLLRVGAWMSRSAWVRRTVSIVCVVYVQLASVCCVPKRFGGKDLLAAVVSLAYKFK